MNKIKRILAAALIAALTLQGGVQTAIAYNDRFYYRNPLSEGADNVLVAEVEEKVLSLSGKSENLYSDILQLFQKKNLSIEQIEEILKSLKQIEWGFEWTENLLREIKFDDIESLYLPEYLLI